MPKRVLAILFTSFCWSATACAEEILVPVNYQGHQIDLTARFEKPPGLGPFPVVILLHNCAGIDGSASLPIWAQLLWSRGYAALRPDSFTARGYGNVCANVQVRPAERAQDVFAAADLLAVRPDVRPDQIAVLGLSHGAVPQFTSRVSTRSCAPAGAARNEAW
jgi:dienelactone hydrolase